MNDIVLDKRFLADLFDFFSLGCIVVSPEQNIVYMNQSAETITGQSASDITGKPCHRRFSDLLCQTRCPFRENTANREKNERIHPVSSGDITKVILPLPETGNRPGGYLEIFQDHSVVRDLIERVRHDDRRLKIILDNLDIGVLTVDCGAHVTFFNTKAETITGFSRGEVLGKPSGKLFGRNFSESLSRMFEATEKEQNRFSEKVEIRIREGQVIPVQANYMPLKNEDARIVGGLATISDLSLLYQFNSAIRNRYTFYDMVGKDPLMQKIFDTASVVAASDATVLIEGPTGTGKDVLAKVLHNASGRADKPLVKVNCAALPDNLLESELFGYVRGAFTGADRDKPGRFQDADGGTIFLDEIGDLPLFLQGKLLHVLEEQEFYPLGSRKTVKVNVRIISATNRDLKKRVQKKKFRQDLFYRLNVIRFELPPLKDRRGDLVLLTWHILKRLSVTRDSHVKKISEEAMEALLNYDFPGNIRELENIIEHALIVCQGSVIEKRHLPVSLFKKEPGGREEEEKEEASRSSLSEGEAKVIVKALEEHGWNRKETARALNINRSTLWRKMKKHNIGGGEFR
jgi:PAS domain S-box-containing protein